MNDLWKSTAVLHMDQPPSSPNLNVLDWSIWSQIQNKMLEKHDSVVAMKVDVMRATEEHRSQMDMDAIRKEFVRRLFACLEARGGHVEHNGRTFMDYRAQEAMAAAGLTGAV